MYIFKFSGAEDKACLFFDLVNQIQYHSGLIKEIKRKNDMVELEFIRNDEKIQNDIVGPLIDISHNMSGALVTSSKQVNS